MRDIWDNVVIAYGIIVGFIFLGYLFHPATIVNGYDPGKWISFGWVIIASAAWLISEANPSSQMRRRTIYGGQA